MLYRSSRGKVTSVSFEETLFSGYAADGGLFVPETIPRIDQTTLEHWIKTKPSYPTIVRDIVRKFVSLEELPNKVLQECVSRAYASFKIDEIVGIHNCKSENGQRFKVAELFHGPTASFKDYALSLVGQIMQYFLSKSNKNTIALVGTSGDTGSAAINAVKGLKGIDIIVLYPRNNISSVQELQMNAATENNVHVFSVEGTSDELDVPIKKSFPDSRLCSINSMNWARILIQIAHYVYLYIQEEAEIDIFVPTGGAGNCSAGVVASLMGIPVKLFVATNENDNVNAFLNKGELRYGGDVVPTPANAMDIGFAYNLERIIYFFSDPRSSPKSASNKTAGYMEACESTNCKTPVKLSEELMASVKEVIQGSASITTGRIYETIRECWRVNNYMICPHTAAAVAFLQDYDSNKTNSTARPKYVIATASPLKFIEVISAAGVDSGEWKGLQLHDELISGPQVEPDKTMEVGADWFEILQHKISKIESEY